MSSNDEKQGRFVDYVGRILSMCRNLNKFAIELRYNKCFASNVNQCVEFAIKHKVKDITLRFWRFPYELPQLLYSHSSLSKLSVSYCVMVPLGSIAWGSLKSLKIESMELSDSVMENILSNSPLLKILKLYFCSGLINLNIDSPNLTTLHYCDDEVCGDVSVISAPYLCKLSIFIVVGGRQYYKFTNVLSVVQAIIGIRKSYLDTSNIRKLNHVKQLLQSLRFVEIFELGLECLQSVSVLEVESWNLPLLTKLQTLTLNVSDHDKGFLSVILAILRSSPNLRTLVIDGSGTTDYEEMKSYQYEIHVMDCNMDNLKTVEIDCYRVTAHMLALVQSLLKCSKVLKMMVIRVKKDPYISIDYEEITKKLLTFPRASAEVVVVLKQN